MNDEMQVNEDLNGVAVIGMAARLPGANNVDEFWRNIRDGIDCITFYNDQELIDAGINPEVLKHPDYVKAKGAVGNVDMFDASFFGINPREAEVTDPQHRMLLECAWEAMEHAGYDSSKYDGPIGIYGGKSMDYYLLLNVYPHIKREISAGSLQAAIGNDKDSLTTTISYRLNLTGPGITIQTSSSTSLVATCVACQSLMTYQCDMALAGGITAGPPIRSGYLYQEGNIWASDGHCRAFDARAQGFIPGSGMGLVVLKRLEDAAADGDHIWAVIKGFAVNNDGSKKVSYSAPSVDAQAEVVAEAQAVAGVHPESIQYIETHGTGTNLGDPIEMTALTQAFRAHTAKKQFCAIGSVKTNIGHLDTAAGAIGLIKTVMAIKNKLIPPSLHYQSPNPKIDFENSPFFVNTKLREWQVDGTPRRAGVTSIGMGGTNAHVILEEYSPPAASECAVGREYKLLLLSAKTETALNKMTENLRDYIKTNREAENPDLNLSDAAFTLSLGRRDFNYRRAVLCRHLEEAESLLTGLTPGRVFDTICTNVETPVVFMFSGQGSQYVNMAKGLYLEEPVFKENIDLCAQFLIPIIGCDLRELIYPEKEEDIEKNAEQLKQTHITQPVLFMIEYSLAQMCLDWGIKPAGMIGHSIGEYAAACTAGCIALEDALNLVALRGRLMHKQEKGAMLSVGLTESKIMDMLPEDLSMAAVNSPKHCVVSGKREAVAKFEKQLSEKEIFCKQLRTSHAFHSPMMEPIMAEFAEAVSKVKLNPPEIPFSSGVTGAWIKAEEVTDPQYWAKQLRQAVRFSDGIEEILTGLSPVLLEIGPGNSLCLLAKEHKTGASASEPALFSTVRHIKQTEADTVFLLKNLSGLWGNGVRIDWNKYYEKDKPQRIPLPTYPFERKRYWLEEIEDSAPQIALKTEQEKVIPGTGAAEEEEKQKETAEKSFQSRPVLPNEYEAPTDEVEEKLAEIWADILGIRPIGISDNFFDLGGHSLLATLFLSRLQEQFHIRLEMRTIFEEPTIASVAGQVKAEQEKSTDAKKIEDLLREVEEEVYPELVPVKKREYYTLSSIQERFYLLQYMELAGKSFNMTGLMEMTGKLENERFAEAFRNLIERHETLRTSFEIANSKPSQKVHSLEDIEFAIEYYESAPGVGERSAAPEELIERFIRPFDLSQPPLLRIGLIKTGPEKHILMFDMHHIISDGVSMNLLVKDLTAFYSGQVIPPLHIQYKDFCEWQNLLLTSGKFVEQEKYWLEHLSGTLPVLNMPIDFPRPEYLSSAGETIRFVFDEELSAKINRLMRETGTTLFMMLLAFYNVLLSKSAGQEDIIVGLPTAGRNRTELENIIGLFMETLVIRNFPSAGKTFAGFLKEVKENTINAFDNQAYPYGELIKKVGDEKNHARNPLFDAMLIVQNMEGNLSEIKMGELKLLPYSDEAPQPAKTDICLEAEERDRKIFLKLKYSTALFKKETMEYFVSFFKEIVSLILENKEVKLGDISVSHHLAQASAKVYGEEEPGFDF
jgi:phthiocerol/phenolphthiocerol synthesis type-I polyketide synthase E